MKKHLQKIKAVLLFIFISSFGFSQQMVTGTVKDASGYPLVDANVKVKESDKGSVTDLDGTYSIEVEQGQTLVFTFLGYQTKTVKVGVSRVIDIVLSEQGLQLEMVSLIGSRNPSRTVIETPVPVDVIALNNILASSPQMNLNQILNYVAPSFTSNVQNIADGTDHIDPASLRGLGPDQVLVLINGKRRHTTSLINVNGSFGRGNVGTDLNAIPATSIEKIEILRDGAAAQYGSDAIAGVINIVLKKSTDKLSINLTTGANMSQYSNDQTGGVDGEKYNLSANYGISLGKKGGYVNFTGDFDVRDNFGRMKEWEGKIFSGYNTVERLAQSKGKNIANLTVADVRRLAPEAGFTSEKLQQISAATDSEIKDSSDDGLDVISFDNTEKELLARNMKRSDFNMRVGQSALRGGRFFMNFALPIDDNNTEIYSFGGLSKRAGNSAGFYRLPYQARTYTKIYPNGFLPEINSAITDKSIAMGIKGKTGNWDVDFSNTYGINSFLYFIGNTSNASLESSSPTSFDAGGFSFSQNTTNLDINQFYNDIFSGLNVALGAEYRVENYQIVAGEEKSYGQYQSNGVLVTPTTPNPTTDFFGVKRPGVSQVFPGFSPDNEASRNRSSVAGYLDLEADITDKILLEGAARFENYSDFGNTLNFKLATRIKITDDINFRASGSTGFRAPSLHQLYFSSTSTLFTGGVPQEVGTFPNDSRIAKLLGIPKLKHELSKSIGAGFTASVTEANIKVTVDGFFVTIDDRVVYTGQFKGKSGTEIGNILEQANATKASFFANAIDTETKGVEAVITHKVAFGSGVVLKTDLSTTYLQTRQIGDIKASDILKKADLVSTYFNNTSRIFLEKAVPKIKGNLSFTLSKNKLSLFLRNAYFGSVVEAANAEELQQKFRPKVVTDFSVSYNLLKNLTLTAGANNILDIYPDKITDNKNRSGGRFDWSRRSQQFGMAGRYVFARLSFNIR